jgi:hypothetical protein
MRFFKTVVLAALAGVLMAVPAIAATDAGCDGKMCDHNAACCNHEGDKIAATVLMPQPMVQPPRDERTARQTAVVTFMRPVKIGDRVLLGKYIIEHDNNRMARGLPCTHIYEASDPRLPVVRFHCTHLDRPRVDRDTVSLISLADPTGMMKMTEFQFAGDAAGHGVPTSR